MKKLLLTILSVATLTGAAGQLTIPRFELRTLDDHTRCNDLVLELCSWLINTPLDKAAPAADEVIAFLFDWSTGSPDVTIVFDDSYMPYLRTLTPLLAWHIAGSVKYQLERGIDAVSVEELRESTLAGVNAVLDCYEENRDFFGPHKGLERMAKARKKGRLEKLINAAIRFDRDPE